MSERHDEIRQDIPAFVLGGLSPDEEQAVREHLRGCEECRREAASYEPLRQALDLAAPDTEPPPGARDRLMERTSNVRTLPVAPEQPPREASRPRYALNVPWVLAAASLLVAVLLGGFLWQQNRQLSGEVATQQDTINGVVDLMERADLQVLDLETPRSEVRARVYAAREGDAGMFVFDHLPPLPQGQVYELWVGDGENLSSSGTFTPTDVEKGSYHELMTPPGGFDQYEFVGVTVSPQGGLEQAPPGSDPAWVTQSEIPSLVQASRG